MRIRQLHCFVVLAEELNFTRAAQRLNMSQPPLSLQIQSLERALGVELFQRSSRRITLTRAGEVFERGARRILAQHDLVMQELQEIRMGQHGVLNIGTTGSILRAGLAVLLAKFCDEFPRITVHLHEQAPELQINGLVSGRMDVIFNRSAPGHEDLACDLAWQEDMVVLLPDDHPLCDRAQVALDDLKDQRHIVLRPDSSDFAALIMSLITRSGGRPRVSQQVVDAQSIPSLVAAGFGISILPAGIATLTSGPLAFRPIAPDGPVSDIFTIYHRSHDNPALTVFLDAIRRFVSQGAVGAG
ncbi:LysR substrate-binding domain-containing protein [Paracoccus sp. DMF-8]|uniref:LysR substrate-binding domain-containing protein n=1 Tax=Paracoccus sp. DMF-8 TaxID=3019445 RepID=UPI0023E46D8E|nr:LysR substrate-binding domain-containing protein [Paracoccus sp. DMF-8]MDF3608131.1 LysR substrate-binding domain-containing protein [Paracoccus sp. DMF-8]